MPSPTANYSFAFNGFVFGAGTPYPILSVDGLEGLPDLRVQDDNQGYNDGMFTGRDFYSGRYLTIEILTLAGNGNSAVVNFNLLQQAMLPQQSGTTVMQFLLSASDTLKRINVRVRKRGTLIDPEYTYGYIKSTWQFFAPDPRYYDDTQQTATLSNAAALGRSYNRTYNLVYASAPATYGTLIQNNGWTTTYPTITVTGPATSITLGNITTGQYMTFTVNLSNTDTMVVDLASKLITVNGSPARNYLSNSSQWFGAQAGANYFYFNASNTLVGTTTCSVAWRSAYV